MAKMQTYFTSLANGFEEACAGKVVASQCRVARQEAAVDLVVARRKEVDLIFLATLRALRHPKIEIGCMVGLRHEPSQAFYESCISGTPYRVPPKSLEPLPRARGHVRPIWLTAMFWDLEKHLPSDLSTTKVLHRDASDEAALYLRRLASFASNEVARVYSPVCSIGAIAASARLDGLSVPWVNPMMKGAVLACAGTEAQFEAWSTRFLERSKAGSEGRTGSRERPTTAREFQCADHAFVNCLRRKLGERQTPNPE